jgi:bacillithiol synthase
MQKIVFPFAQVGALAQTDVAYADANPALRPFYQYEPNIAGLHAAIEDRINRAYPRADLVATLREQYRNLDTSALEPHFEALLRNDTFTITTAHQPALLLGPLFFIYKAITTIQTAAAVQRNTGKHIIPVFVLGSEDHDLDELNHANLFNRKIVWEPNQTGPVGSMDAKTVAPVLETLRPVLGESANAQVLSQLLEDAYNNAATFAEATQRLLHALLGRFGLVVLNMSTPRLKQHFVPVMQDELLQQSSYRLVNETTTLLREAGFKTQAAPREINLFYLTPGRRDRIVKLPDGRYQIGIILIKFQLKRKFCLS